MQVRRPQFGFLHHGFIDPDFMKCTFDWMLDDARLGLMKGCPMAYFWFASSRSDLYTFWGPRLEDMLDRPLTPASQQFRLVEFGLEPYPDAGISRIVIDTEDRTDRWYADPGMPSSHYLRKVAASADGLKWLDGAVSNGVQIVFHGEHSSLLRQALRHYLRHTMDAEGQSIPPRMQHQSARAAVEELAASYSGHCPAPVLHQLAA